jgi:phosphoserine aminotransferase
MLSTQWLLDDVGGLEAIDKKNQEKAALLYDTIDQSDGFYRGHAQQDSRSLMNVTWRLPDEALEAKFVEQALACDLHQLKGHRSVGGMRASIYNAMTLEGVQALRDFMVDFQKENG